MAPNAMQNPETMNGSSQSQPPSMQQKAAETSSIDDAFAHLSVASGSTGNNSMTAPAPTQAPAASANKAEDKKAGKAPKYAAKQVVCYKSNGNRSKAQIVKVGSSRLGVFSQVLISETNAFPFVC